MKKIILLFLSLSISSSLYAEEEMLPVDITAEEVSYFQQEGKAIANKNVKITYKDVVLYCDSAEYDAKKHTAYLKGKVKVVRQNSTLYAEEIVYNFSTQEAEAQPIKIESPPLYGKAQGVQKVGEQEYRLRKGYLTTCDLEKPHYRLEAQSIRIYPKIKVVAKNVFLKVGGLPIFYFPYYKHSLKDTSFPLQIVPGKKSDWGYYVLGRWRYYLGERQRGKIHFDWYEERGFAQGISHKFETKNFGQGLINYYFIEDDLYRLNKRQTLFDKYPEREAFESRWLEDDRFKGKLAYSWEIGDNLSIKAEFNKFSDAYFMKDFFFREYEVESHPLSYIYADYRLPSSSLSLLAQKRFNPFFSETEYLPKLEYNLYPQNLGGSNFYFSSQTSIGNLGYRSGYTDEEFDAWRFHTYNLLSYQKNIKWLSLQPYAGIRSTFYSQTPTEEEACRYSPEVGLNLSTKLYRDIDREINLLGIKVEKFRHILSPIINYQYIFKPNISKNAVYQFDTIDDLSQNEMITLKLENKLKAKVKEKIWDFLYFSPGLEYSLKEEAGSGGYFKKIFARLEAYPKEGFSLNADVDYNCPDRALRELNTDLTLYQVPERRYSFSLGHRYLRQESSQTTTSLTYQINPKLQFKNYLRYEYKEREFKEQEYALRLDLHCWWLDLGLNINKEKDLTFWFAFVLKDFPDIHIGFDHTYRGAKESY